MLKCVRNFHTFIFIFIFSPSCLCHYKMVSRPCYTKAVLWVCSCLFYILCGFRFAHVCRLYETNILVLCPSWLWVRKTHLIQLLILQLEVIRCVERGVDRKMPSTGEDRVTLKTKHSKLSPAIISNVLLHRVAGGQQHSIEKQKTKAFYFLHWRAI